MPDEIEAETIAAVAKAGLFEKMFPEEAKPQANGNGQEPTEPAEGSQPSEEQADETPETEATEEAEVGEEESSTEAQPETATGEEPPKKGRGAEFRIKQLLEKNKVLESQLGQYGQTMEQLQAQLKQVQEANKPKGWGDLSVAELKAIKMHPNATDEQRAMAEQNLETAILREAEDRATKAAQKVIQEQLGTVAQQQRHQQIMQSIYTDYPEVQKEDSELRAVAGKIFDGEGIPEYGLGAKELQARGAEGIRMAVDAAFNRLSRTTSKTMGEKMDHLKKKAQVAGARNQLEGSGRPGVSKPPMRARDLMKKVERTERGGLGDDALKRILDSVHGDGIPSEPRR